MQRPDLILIGLRGSGKSTVGRAAAARLNREFVDLDDLTPGVMGFASIAEAWSAAGEPGFRNAEVNALERLLRSDPSIARVIALGGGTPTAPGAEALLRGARRSARAAVVYLRARAPALRSRLRISENQHRPALTPSGDVLDEIEQVFQRRDALYRGVADAVIHTDEKSLEDVVDELVGWVGT